MLTFPVVIVSSFYCSWNRGVLSQRPPANRTPEEKEWRAANERLRYEKSGRKLTDEQKDAKAEREKKRVRVISPEERAYRAQKEAVRKAQIKADKQAAQEAAARLPNTGPVHRSPGSPGPPEMTW